MNGWREWDRCPPGAALRDADPDIARLIEKEIERQTERKVELASRVDDDILGGIVLQVGNMVLDASIRSRVEKLRKSVASAA